MFKSNRQCTERRVQRLTSLPLTIVIPGLILDPQEGYYLLHGSEVLALRKTLRGILIKAEELEFHKRLCQGREFLYCTSGSRYVFEATAEEIGLSTKELASLGFEIWVDRYGNRHGKLSLPHFLPPK